MTIENHIIDLGIGQRGLDFTVSYRESIFTRACGQEQSFSKWTLKVGKAGKATGMHTCGRMLDVRHTFVVWPRESKALMLKQLEKGLKTVAQKIVMSSKLAEEAWVKANLARILGIMEAAR